MPESSKAFSKLPEVGKVTPVHKKGIYNYLITIDLYLYYQYLVGYILDSAASLHLKWWFMTNNLDLEPTTQQLITHAVNYSFNHILDNLEKKNYVIGTFIDLSKALDTILTMKNSL
jgi:hypothetical protein